MKSVPGALCVSLLLIASHAAAAPTTLEREFRYPVERFRVSASGGETQVSVQGATRDWTAGHPELPILSERVDLPAGMRVARVELVRVETAALAERARIVTARKAVPGFGPIERTAPDPAFYQRAGFQPDAVAELGNQGFLRGQNVAWVKINPVRWDATSGRLERVTRAVVRLTLEPAPNQPDVVVRERVVPAWEDAGTPTSIRAAGSFALQPGGGRSAQPFLPTQIPSVLGSPVAYVIITGDALVGEFQRLADWKTQTGVPAVVRTLSFIRQEYPFGTDDADRIRQFIRDAYARWGTKWVLLGGDTDVIPTRLARTTFFGGEDIASDLYFSCLDGTWNADGDNLYGEGYFNAGNPGDACDLMPEVYVGRAPTSSVPQAQLFVNKTLMYEKTPVGDYENSHMFFAEVLFPQPWSLGTQTFLDGAEVAEDVMPYFNGSPAMHTLRMYENYTDPRWPAGSLPLTRATVLDTLDRGYNLAVHIGHGYRNVMSVGDATMDNSDAFNLTNGNRLFNLYAIDCTSNAIDYPCIGEAFILAPNGGAVTNIGSTRVDFPYSGRVFEDEYFRLMLEDSVTAVGEAQARQKLPWAGSSTTDNLNRWTEFTLLMLGDPELRLWLERPRTLTVTTPSGLSLSDTAHTVSDTTLAVKVKIGGVPLYGARVTAYKVGDEYRTATTDGAGNIVLDFRPNTTGSFTLTVTGFDCRPYQVTLNVTAATNAALIEQPVSIDDDNAGGTSGNSNGVFDAGETVDVRIPIKNVGTIALNGVTGTLSTTDAYVTMINPTDTYAPILAGSTANGFGSYRMRVPLGTKDQRELAFRLDLLDGSNRHFLAPVRLTVRSPELRHFSHGESESGGNNNGVPEPGETVSYFVRLKNLGSGGAANVRAVLRDYDGLATVTDSTAVWGAIGAGQEVQGDALVFSPSSAAAKLALLIFNQDSLITTQTLDIGFPSTPTAIVGFGHDGSIDLTWTRSPQSDLLGYNIYRSATSGGVYTKVNTVPTDRTAYYKDEGLAALTPYYYKVTAVDSAANESATSSVVSASTNPPLHTVFPMETKHTTPSSVAIEHVYQATQMDIISGSEVLYVWHADGTAPLDADGMSVSNGDFSSRGAYFAAAPSAAKLDGIHWSLIGASWDSTRVYVFDTAGNVRPGWPLVTSTPVWSSIAIGDLNNDGQNELVFGSNGSDLYAMRANGSEWIDGDSNPGTKGIFHHFAAGNNVGSPALADLDGNGQLDIIFAGFDGFLYAWRPDGTDLPGFPVNLHGFATASPAVGYLDGPSDTQLDIVVPGGDDSLYAVRADGTIRPGFPVRVKVTGTSRAPSPALADIDLDGKLDIVQAGTDGKIYVYDRNGVLNPNFANVRYSNLGSYASESSPVVADINGDGIPDIIMGDEEAFLNGFSGLGTQLPGFPIKLGGEVRGTPAVCDCDDDGLSEIVVSDWDDKTYMWDYNFPFSPAGPPAWPQFRHDARRTGLSTAPVFVDAPPPPSSVPDVVEFAPPSPNPARHSARLTWAVPRASAGQPFDLGVFDLAGRRVATLAAGPATAGRFDADWDLRSSGGTTVGTGMYFVRFRIGGETRSQKLLVLP